MILLMARMEGNMIGLEEESGIGQAMPNMFQNILSLSDLHES